jgi:hypothetical protein
LAAFFYNHRLPPFHDFVLKAFSVSSIKLGPPRSQETALCSAKSSLNKNVMRLTD